jgi:hypothetical protein
MQADAERRFTNFVNLPAELRNLVYEFYVGDFGTERYPGDPPVTLGLTCPVHPPLSRVSRMLRHEVLPIFYGQCAFRLMLEWSTGSGRLHFTDGALLFLHTLSSKNVACLRRLEFACYLTDDSFYPRVSLLKNEVVVQAVQPRPEDDVRPLPTPVQHALEEVAMRIREREEINLTLGDVYSMRDAIERNL